MSKFTDAKGREWEIPHFDPLNIAEVKQRPGVSLYTLTAGKMEQLGELFQNVPVFWEVIFVLVKEQARERGVDERSFMQGMIGGDVADAAREAFWEELLFFSPKRLRELLTKFKTQMDQMRDEATMPTDQQIRSAITDGLKKLFGDSSELPDSPPAG